MCYQMKTRGKAIKANVRVLKKNGNGYILSLILR